MQRFKREFIRRLHAPAGSDLADLGKVARMAVAANPEKKFIYGAYGTLTPAARWRIEEITAISLITATRDKSAAGIAMFKGSAARLGGWQLP